MRGYWTTGKERLRIALGRDAVIDAHLKARGLAAYGYLLFNQNDQTAKSMAEEGAKISQQIRDDEAQAWCLHSLACIAEAEGRYPEAQALFMQELQIAKRAKLAWLVAWAQRGLGSVAKAQKDTVSAKQWFAQSLAKREEIGDARGVAILQARLSSVTDDQSHARQLIESSMVVSQARGDRFTLACCQHSLGNLEEMAGNLRGAETAFQNSLILSREIVDKRGMARAQEGLARTAIISGDEKRGAHVYGVADAIRSSISAPLSPDERKTHEALKIEVKKKFLTVYEQGRKSPELQA
jgi:tetratricopeptide (TPR) repeat protein